MSHRMMHVLQFQHRHVHSLHADLAATQRLSDALPTFSCRSTPFRISGPSQQRIDMACSATRPSLGQAARRFGLFLLATVVMRSMERRLVALQETVWHTLLTLEDSATLWWATEAEAQQARRSECRTRRSPGESPCRECCEQHLATGGAMESAHWRASNRPRCAASRTAAREERMHPQPRQRDRREWRDDPTHTNTCRKKSPRHG